MNIPSSNPHIVSDFDADLQDLSQRLAEMGALAGRQLEDALDALESGDQEVAARVVDADMRLDIADQELVDAAVRILLLRQPMAQDLRETVAALRTAGVIERIGDLAKNVARRAPGLAASPELPMRASLLQMGREARQLLADALVAYKERDPEAAVKVRDRDVAIDNAYKKVFEEVVVYMEQTAGAAESGALMLAMARSLERVGDHATFLAEMAYYVAKGTHLDQERPKGDPWGLPSGGEGEPASSG